MATEILQTPATAPKARDYPRIVVPPPGPNARALIERYPPETTVYSGHGPPTTLGAEKERNPFLAELRA